MPRYLKGNENVHPEHREAKLAASERFPRFSTIDVNVVHVHVHAAPYERARPVRRRSEVESLARTLNISLSVFVCCVVIACLLNLSDALIA